MAPKVISASQIKTYLDCSRSYYLRYILGLKEPITSEVLIRGSRIHSKISNLDFTSDNVEEQGFLDNAKNFLDSKPGKVSFETNYESSSNPNKFFGEICDRRAIAIIDAFWDDEDPSLPDAVDWKVSKLSNYNLEHYEIQAYFCSELFKQNKNKALKNFYFKFLKDDNLYSAKILSDPEYKTKIEKKIKKVLKNIEEGKFDKKCGRLCEWCSVSVYCPLDI
jgi:CRISPR/Cas system-associated exonuclease Cas4 (RecB family)